MPPIPRKSPLAPDPTPDRGTSGAGPSVTPPFPKNGGPRVAVNLWDLDRVHPEIVRLVLAGKVAGDKTAIFKVHDRHEDTAVPFVCDPRTAAVACDVLRSECRRCEVRPVRVYVSPDGVRWVRVPERGVLTWVDGGGVGHLSPEFFPTGERPEPVAPTPSAVELG